MNQSDKEKWMQRALALARKGEGRTSPNPPVGAVLVKNGRVVGEGFHRKAGGPHAEVAALKKAGPAAKGADLFLTLEPCCHHGRTPPCTEALIERGVRRVFVGARDPNPMVSGKGIRKLKAAGIAVETGILKKECEGLIEFFAKFIRTGSPYVILKSAQSLDGKIATAGGESQWITGPQARKRGHQLRARVDAILVGVETVIQDNPRLTGRPSPKQERHPLRVVIDPNLRVPLGARIFTAMPDTRAAVVTTPGEHPKKKRLKKMGVFLVEIPAKGGTIPFKKILRALAEMDVVSVLVEGGGETHSRILKEKLVDRVMWFLAPVLIGGKNAPSSIGGEGMKKLQDALRLKNMRVERVGPDLLIEGDL